MERTYKPGRGRAGFEAGDPVLLTPYIERKELDEARKAAYVDPDYLLPDMDSYAGYLTVNKEYNANLWFWYFPVADKPVEETPWIIWLQGGPGASSLYGLFTEIGPFVVTDDNQLEEIKYSWGKNHSLLFIDNPVGTGFSFTDDDRGYATNQTTIGENLYAALQQFLTIFPELRKAPLTVAGESYAGKHIPSLGVQILWHRNEDEPINLQGLAIGNGFIDPLTLQRYSYFVREAGLVDDKVANAMKHLETAVTQFISEGEMLKAYARYRYFAQEARLVNGRWKHLETAVTQVDIAIGKGFIDPLTLQRYSYFVREAGLVDDKIANAMKHLETAVTQFISEGEMLKAYALAGPPGQENPPKTCPEVHLF
ncbi:serine carboxypeptidase domain-containing protein [Phthorimaea operculella]|nr:serine carboxypeptidase domain-containing protein [Phthorimaea operculella]